MSRRLTTVILATTALTAASLLAGVALHEPEPADGSPFRAQALAADEMARRSVPAFAGPDQPAGWPDLTPQADDPGTNGDEAIGFPVEVRAAAVSAPRQAPAPRPRLTNPTVADWERLARCESGGNWQSTVGRYEGGLQFHPGTWDAYRPADYPEAAYEATKQQQIAVAERVLASQGWEAWPACSRALGYR